MVVLTLLWGGVATAFAQESPHPTPRQSAAPPDCSGEACAGESAAAEPTPTPTESTPAPEATHEGDADEASSDDARPDETVSDESDPAPDAGPAEAAQAERADRSALAFADASVEIVDFDFNPGSITISAGETVTWTNTGDEPHTVTADDGSFDSGQLATGDTFSMRFDSPGTYRYYCSLHGGPGGQGMSAVVIVEGGDEADQTPEPHGNSTNDGDKVDNDSEDPAADETPDASAADGSLPRTGGGPPSAWVFALALVGTGVVLARVARLSERAARR